MLAQAEQVVEAAYRDHRAGLVRRLTGITRDPEVAQDLAQEAFLRLAREIDGGRIPDDAGAWLHRVGANLATSRGRHLQVVSRRAASLVPPAQPPSPEHLVVQRELAVAVRAVLAQLSGSERRALLLAANGCGAPEIASSIGRTPGATRTLLCRARSKVRSRLAGTGAAV